MNSSVKKQTDELDGVIELNEEMLGDVVGGTDERRGAPGHARWRHRRNWGHHHHVHHGWNQNLSNNGREEGDFLDGLL